MKKLLSLTVVICAMISLPMVLFAQIHLQPCHGQDTSRSYRTKTLRPYAIAASRTGPVAVANHSWDHYGDTGTVKIWRDLTRLAQGLKPNDSIHLKQPSGLVYDYWGNLFVVQSERADSNIMVYDTGRHLIRAISNSVGTPYSWFNPRGITIDSVNDIYVLSGDSVTSSGADVPNSGKLIKITNPLTSATKTAVITGLNDPKGVYIKDDNLYVTEYGNNMVNRYRLSSMVKIDSVTVNKPMDLFSTGCKLYCTEHDSNSVRILNAINLATGSSQQLRRLDTCRGPFGLLLNNDQDLFICDSNRVIFYSDSEGVTDTDWIAGSSFGASGYVGCFLNQHSFTFSDSNRGGVWHTHDSTSISIHRDALNDSVVHVFGIATGTYSFTYSYGTGIDTFYITIAAGDISTPVVISDSMRGGTWSTLDSSIIAIASGPYDSVVYVYGYRTGFGRVFYTWGSHTDTFYVGFEMPITAGRIYVYDDAGEVYGSYRMCIGNTVQLYDEHGSTFGNWSTADTSVVFIDEAFGVVWPKTAGTATIRHTVGNSCGISTATFILYIDSEYNVKPISGLNWLCEHATLVLKDSTLGGSWLVDGSAYASITGAAGDSVSINGLRPGVATIKYYVSNRCADTVYKKITVRQLPRAGTIIAPDTVCQFNVYNIHSTGSPYGGYWTSSNVAIASVSGHDSNATLFSRNSGVVTIRYIDSNSCGSATASRSVVVRMDPYAGTTSGPTVLCERSVGVYSNAGDAGGVWSTGGHSAVISSTGGIALGTRGMPFGIVDTIYYTVSNPCGSSRMAYPITVRRKPNLSVITPGSVHLCPGDTISESATATTGGGAGSGQRWSLSNSNASIIGSATVSTVTVGARSSGSVVLSDTAYNMCGDSILRVTLFIDSLPNAGTISGSASACLGTTTAYASSGSGGRWALSNGRGSISSSGVLTGIYTGIDTVYYIDSSSCGRDTARLAVTIFPYPSVGTTTGPTQVCVGASISLSNSTSGGTWSVTNSHASVSSAGSVTGASAGIDTILYRISNFCGTATATYVDTVLRLPNAGTISGASNICIGTPITFTNTASTGSWGITNSRATISTAGVVNGITVGADTVLYIDISPCGRDTSRYPITVIAVPRVSAISGPSHVCLGSSITLADSVSGGAWSASNGHATISSAGLVNTVSAGLDTFFYTITNYCGTARASHVDTVIDTPHVSLITGPTHGCIGASECFVAHGSSDVRAGIWTSSSSRGTFHTVSDSTGCLWYTSPGPFTIFYSVTNVCGTDSASFNDTTIGWVTASAITGPSSVCIGASITLTDSVAGGTWRVTNSRATISSSGVVGGVSAGLDTVFYIVSNLCGSDTAFRTITINSLTHVADTISVNHNPVCAGDTVTFTVNPTNGGSSPFFQWKRFGMNVDTGTTFTYVPTVGDLITCDMTSSALCPSPSIASSNSITMVVNPLVTPTVSIVASPGDSVTTPGQLITFFSTVTYGGSPTLYQWYEHGAPVAGATSSSFSTHVFSNDTVYCKITSNIPCPSATVATSNVVVINADYLTVGDVHSTIGSMVLYPNPNTGSFVLQGQLSNGDRDLKIQVTDVVGRVLYERSFISQDNSFKEEIALEESVAPGIYFLKTGSGGESRVIRFTKE